MMEEVVSFFKQIFGIEYTGSPILQIIARSFVMYIVGIALVRIGKKRFIGKMTAFDTIIAIIIGSLLSRGIVEPDLFVKIIFASVFLIALHRLFSFIAAYSERFGNWIKGKERIIIQDGKILWHALRKSNLSKQDLMQTLRLNAHTTDINKIKVARLERNGDISVLMQE